MPAAPYLCYNSAMSSDDITALLGEIGGNKDVARRVYPLIYDELRRLSQAALQKERANHTLQATELVHEAYLRLVDQTRVQWQNRSHFFAIAAQAVRRILVDHARKKGSQKRGGDYQRIDIDDLLNMPVQRPSATLAALDDAMQELAKTDEAKIVEMRFFGGMTNEEIASVLDVSLRKVERHWQFARLWLFRELKES